MMTVDLCSTNFGSF